ncbi:MAG: hypothetical protein FWC09_08675 [Lachnospiraceae bacterium]|nr:hypothetical protein [Lachnospiraceae bacterium]
MNEENFITAKNKVIGISRERHGIGTQREKTVHAVLKYYYAPDEDMHEIPIDSYIADIYTGREIIEIQTAQMYRMRGKLECFLSQYPVTIVHPIPRYKWLSWIDTDTGECSGLRKSPKKGSVYQVFGELYRIRAFLNHENLRFCFPFIDIEEYRLLNGWSHNKKRGSERYDRIPVALKDEVRIDCKEDYLQFIPYELPEPFTSAELAQATKIRRRDATVVLNVLNHVGAVKRVGKKGHNYTYTVNSKESTYE